MFRFQKLEVWRESIAFADLIYDLAQRLPRDERFGLTSQMRRAGISVSSNIAEGTGRSSDVDFARFVEIAYGSLMEVASQSHIAERRSWFTEPQMNDVLARAEQLARMLSGLQNITAEAGLMMRSSSVSGP